MIQVGENQFEITNKKTGEKKVVAGEELSQYGLENPNQKKSLGTKFAQKLQNIPLVGDASKTMASLGTGLAAAIKTPFVERNTMKNQELAMDLAKRARNEMDPETKKQMLDESRRLSQEAGERATRYERQVNDVMPNFAKGKESPVTVEDKYKAYGMQGLKTGVDAGELMLLLNGAEIYKGLGPQDRGFLNAIKRIGAKTAFGAGTGGLEGFVDGEDKTNKERLSSAKSGAITGAAVSGAISVLGEGVRAFRNLHKAKFFGETSSKITNFKNKHSLQNKIWKQVENASKESKATVKGQSIIDSIKRQINAGYTGKEKQTLLKKLAEESAGKTYNMKNIVDIKSNLGWKPNSTAMSATYNNIKKNVLKEIINTKAPEISTYSDAYALLKSVKSNKLLKKILGWGIAGKAFGTGTGLF